MRGGKREGAGRKPVESTVRVSVPVGVLDEVALLIASYKRGDLKVCQEIKEVPLKACQEIKEAPLKVNQEIKEAIKSLQCLNSRTCKVLRKAFGSLTKAAELGVRAKPDGGIFVPDAIQQRLRPFM